MEPFKIHILGCGSALPTLRHNASSQVVEVRGKMFMIDCGEGTQIQLRRSKTRFTRINHVFISHLHGDHCFGLIGMISSFGMLGRTAALHVYAPSAFEPVLQMELDAFCQGLDFEVIFHGLDTTRQMVIYEDRSLTVSTLPLEHRMPCCGFLFREKTTQPHIRRDMIDFYQIPVSQIPLIKSGAGWTSPDGTVIPHERLTMPAEPPRSYAYCSDTRYMPRLHELLGGVNLLYHESTYDSSNEDRARMFYHSTSRQAARVARDAGVGRLLLGHFSARYEDESSILREACEVFPQSMLATEGLAVDVK